MDTRIAISGKMASGKTTLTSVLTSEYGYRQVVFAGGIKQLAAAVSQSRPNRYDNIYNIIKEVCLNDADKAEDCFHVLTNEIMPGFMGHDLTVKDDKSRLFYQTLGQRFKEIDYDIWIKHALASINPGEKIVADDMRFKNEMQYLKEKGFTTVRLEISPLLQLERMAKMYGRIDPIRLMDISEVDLDDSKFDYVIDASLPLEEVRRQLINIINSK